MTAPITLYNPANKSSIPLTHVNHSVARHKLGVLLCPDGNGTSQILHSIQKAHDFFGKLRNSSLSQKAQWLAVDYVVKPAVMYPLMNSFFQIADIQPIVSVISQLRCLALGLNRHFPMALFYGPPGLGGIGLLPMPLPYHALPKLLSLQFSTELRDRSKTSYFYYPCPIRNWFILAILHITICMDIFSLNLLLNNYGMNFNQMVCTFNQQMG